MSNNNSPQDELSTPVFVVIILVMFILIWLNLASATQMWPFS